MAPVPFTLSLPEPRLQRIRDRVAAFDWTDFPDAGGWSAGVSSAEMQRIAAYWLDGFDWRAQEDRLNRLAHFQAEIDGIAIHFVSIQGSNSGARPPLVLIHGWPGSFIEFEAAAERLAHPERFGGRAEDGFDLIIPSLPGYGLSGRPASPIGPRAASRLFHTLMTEHLGHDRYIAQGGDWGSVVSAWLAHDYPAHCVALHLNMCLLQRGDARPNSPEAEAYLAAKTRMMAIESGYSHQQYTRPQTLGFGLSDSPVGAAAWILEKFAVWSDLPRPEGVPDLEAVYSLDQLLTNVMLYVGTGTMVTSTWFYRGSALEGGRGLEHRIEVPTALAAFPDPVFPPPPRSYAEQSYAFSRWTPMERGGHFAAMEQPEAFADDVRAFVLSL
ncbi:alpha/beta fold hydrolase [Rhizobium sp. CRIBSB]|nr:alpha/beta fold hydrolase [Rhizobium sp. CRIBSB]